MNKISLEQFDSVAFDVEGTLADTIPTHHIARARAFKDLGYGHITPAEHALGPTYGSTTPDIIGGVLHAANAITKTGAFSDHPEVQRVMAAKMRYFGEIAANGFDEIPGATAFFKEVATHFDGKTALVTASQLPFVLPFLERYDLRNFLTDYRIITAETLDTLSLKAKPAGDPYALAAQRMQSKHMLVFEDTVPGVAAAKAAEQSLPDTTITVIALGFEAHSAKLFRQGGLAYMPDYFVEDYAQARQLLGFAV